jgi:hypothetical protein
MSIFVLRIIYKFHTNSITDPSLFFLKIVIKAKFKSKQKGNIRRIYFLVNIPKGANNPKND